MPILGYGLDNTEPLKPIRYPWAFDCYEQAIRNTWFPNEIQLGEDIADFKRMTPDEQQAIPSLMSFFNPGEFTVNRALAFGLYPYLSPAEAQMYVARQMFEEANHSMSFEYVLETFPIDREAAYNAHLEIPEMVAKEEFINKYIGAMLTDPIDINTIEGKQALVRNLVAYNIIQEGVWFYSGFMVALAFRQRNLLRNFAGLIDWVVRDESLHLKFGLNLILTILDENPEIGTPEFVQEVHDMIIESVALEEAYNEAMFPNGILGLNAKYVNQYVKFLTDRRLEELGFEPEYNVTNPAKWMAGANDALQLVNFFEATNTSYEANASATSKKSE